MSRQYTQRQIGPIKADQGNPITSLIGNLTIFAPSLRDVVGSLGLTGSGTFAGSLVTPIGIGISNAGTGYWSASSGGKVIGGDTSFAFALTLQLNATGQLNTYVAYERNSVTSNQAALLYGYVANTFELYTPNASVDFRPLSSVVVADTLPHTILYTYDGAIFSGFLDGVQKFSSAIASNLNVVSNSGFIGAATGGAGFVNATFLQHVRFNGGIPLSVARDFTARPWQLIARPSSLLRSAAVAATAVTLTGPSGGVTGVASTNFTVGANGTITGTVIVTPSDSAAGGTFTPATVSISAGTPTGTFTYTPASVGAKTISVTNNGALTNPANLTYTATAAATGSIYMAASMSGLGSGGRLFQNPLN